MTGRIRKSTSKSQALGSYKWIIAGTDLLGGKPTIKGTRISVSMVLECLADGMTPAEIARDYPGFPEQCISEVLKFAAQQTNRKPRKSDAVA